MEARTYTLLVTIVGEQPADAQALADRVAHELSSNTRPMRPRTVYADAFEGDWLGARPVEVSSPLRRVKRRHRAASVSL